MTGSILDLIASQRNQSNQPQPQQQQLNPQIQQVKDLMRAIQANANPQVALQNFLENNPSTAFIANLLQSNGGNLQQAAQALAQQKGIDLDTLIQQLRN